MKTRMAAATLVALLGLVLATSAVADPGSVAISQLDDSDGALDGRDRSFLPPYDAALVVEWNETAYELAFAEDQFFTFKGVRAFAMMHLAIHDALNAIVARYETYAHHVRDPNADPIAAAAQAAHDVLSSQYPGAQNVLDGLLAEWLERVPSGDARNRGVELGADSAAAVLDLRAGDGFDFVGTYTFGSGPGVYKTTPPWDGFVFRPGFRWARPFALQSGDQFRPPPPPSLSSRTYARAFNEVRDFGRIHSDVRTEEQTDIAVWWMEFTEGSMNRLAREIVTEQGTNLWKAARLFALLDLSMFDGYVSVWDSKFAHNHWRPYTAIRTAAKDGNSSTMPDDSWEPLQTTPPFPEFASAHGAVCSSSLTTLAREFGNRLSFEMQTTTAPAGMPTRSFASFDQAAEECAGSRVLLGWHFRYATKAGLKLGRRVATYAGEHLLEPQGKN